MLCALQGPEQPEDLQVRLHGFVIQHSGNGLSNIILQDKDVPAYQVERVP